MTILWSDRPYWPHLTAEMKKLTCSPRGGGGSVFSSGQSAPKSILLTVCHRANDLWQMCVGQKAILNTFQICDIKEKTFVVGSGVR